MTKIRVAGIEVFEIEIVGIEVAGRLSRLTEEYISLLILSSCSFVSSSDSSHTVSGRVAKKLSPILSLLLRRLRIRWTERSWVVAPTSESLL